MSRYFKVLDLNLVGRQDGMFDCFIHKKGQGWVWDEDRILMDRIIGYDGDRIGATSMMNLIKEITEQEALSLTN